MTTHALLKWYSHHARDLPWRALHDPYAIWVAEVMLQQTRVQTVIPYYLRGMSSYPDVRSLAQAEIDEVLMHWEGLGYYRRAHNMLRSANLILTDFGGLLPRGTAELQRLPGIGEYTANAIAAIAFNTDVIAMDGNLRRVFSRLFDFDENLRRPSARRKLLTLAQGIMPENEASSFNQALMDLGATICVSKNPKCDQCPLSDFCLAFERGVQGARPVSQKAATIPHHRVTAGILRENGRVFIARRPEGKLLGGLWEFPGGMCDAREKGESCLRRVWLETLGVKVLPGDDLGVYHHAYSHYRVTVQAMECAVIDGKPKAINHTEIRWEKIADLANYPMGKVDRMIAERLAKPH